MSASASITLARGGLYIPRAVYERHFPGLESVVLLRRVDRLLILPVRHASAGGYLLKLRNSTGDRVVLAPDFFRTHGIEDDIERELTVAWSKESAALAADGVFSL